MPDEPSGRNLDEEAPVAEAVVETEEATITEDAELERTIGLAGGLAIGIGTMIGAGIFVFPGLAGGEDLLAAAAARLRGEGIGAETTLATAGSPFDALVDAVPGHDAVVIGERAPSVRSFVFGEESDRVAAASVSPVLVVRLETADDGDATAAADEWVEPRRPPSPTWSAAFEVAAGVERAKRIYPGAV